MKWDAENLSPTSYMSNSSSWISDESLKSTVWTRAENKLFENALAKFDKDTPDRWQRVADLVPGKTAEDVRRQYEKLEFDVNEIEADIYPDHEYEYSCSTSPFTLDFKYPPYRPGCKRSPVAGAGVGRPAEQERKKGVPWTEEEHRQFLRGLKKYGKGDWRNISRYFVRTRTPTQVASHAQKYFIRQVSGGKDKRRASIHDITTVNLNEDHIPSLDGIRTPSPEECKFGWNQPNGGGTAMAFNQSHGNLFMSPRYGGNLYGGFRGVAGGGGLLEAYNSPQNMVFQMQPAMHYPHG